MRSQVAAFRVHQILLSVAGEHQQKRIVRRDRSASPFEFDDLNSTEYF